MVSNRGDSSLETAKSGVADGVSNRPLDVKEDHYHKALKVREDYERDRLNLVEPSLLLFEVSNVLRYSRELGLEDGRGSLHSTIDLQLDIRELDHEWACRATVF